jgi:hypothetical protein
MIMVMRKPIVLIFFFLWLFQCAAQQNNTWFFGSTAGLNFNPNGNGLKVADKHKKITEKKGTVMLIR